MIIDKDFLTEHNLSLNKYKMGDNVKNLDDLFINYIKKKILLKKNLYNNYSY